MEFKDKTLKCKDCGKDFIFSAGEQAFFAEKGFDREPVRCAECRKAKKQKQGAPNPHIKKVEEAGEYEIVCKKCGKKVEVPFKPKFPEDILCSDCFEANK